MKTKNTGTKNTGKKVQEPIENAGKVHEPKVMVFHLLFNINISL